MSEESEQQGPAVGWAIAMLREQGMPSREIAAILEADSGQLVRQYLELHRERLEEHLAYQRRTLARLDRLLVSRTRGTAARPRKATVSPA
jgi:DNA-binding transcriptional MerR regulator